MSRTEARYGLWLHPHAPAAVSVGRPDRVHWSYHIGTSPALFQKVADVAVSSDPWRLVGEGLERFGIVADTTRQDYQTGGPFFFYADFSRSCRECGEEFVYTAEAQRFWYEELGRPHDSVADRCAACRAVSRGRRQAQRRWGEALEGWRPEAPTVEAGSALASAALDLVETREGSAKILDLAMGALHIAARAAPDSLVLDAWTCRLEAARGRAEAAFEAGQRYIAGTVPGAANADLYAAVERVLGKATEKGKKRER